MKISYFAYILLSMLLSIGNLAFSQQAEIQKISQEQKLYEFSVIWKELSYNFAHMDKCPGLDLDSLYRAYIPIVQQTTDDYEYARTIQHFLAHLNDSHTASSIPDYIQQHFAYPLLYTKYDSGKLIITYIGAHYSDKINPGDEIIKIDEIPAMDYIEKYGIAFVSASNPDVKINRSMLGWSGITHAPKFQNKRINIDVNTSQGIETVEIPFDMYFYPEPQDTLRQNEYSQNIKYLDESGSLKRENMFLTDSLNSVAYIRLLSCDEHFYNFFVNHYDSIRAYDNLIIDIVHNQGGDGNATIMPAMCLINNDSIGWSANYSTRVHNAWNKAKAASRIFYFESERVSQEDKDLYYPFYYGTAFEMIDTPYFKNHIEEAERYKGNIYVMVSPNTASAAESFMLMLTQNPKTTILGKKTEGANDQPLVVRLPSGIEVYIGTAKSYDLKGNDISSGITPDYIYDFAPFYKTDNPNEMLEKFVGIINALPEKN